MEKKSRILDIESYGLVLEEDSVERVKDIMEPVLLKLGEEIEYDYRRFQFIAARIVWRIMIREFEYVDNVLIKLRSAMNKYFDRWGIRIIIKYEEGG